MRECILVANLEGQGWYITMFTILLVLTWGLRYFWKTGNIKKSVRWNRGLRHFYRGFEKITCKACLLFYFYCPLVIKRIIRVLFAFIPWSLNSSDLPSYGSNSRKRYTIRLLSLCLGRSTLPLWVKPPSLLIALDGSF